MSTMNRRTFLTNTAATVGGIAMAGSVVDGLLATAADASLVNTGTPKRGGTLVMGTQSDVPNYHVFSGALGKMDASGFCVANACFDPLFRLQANGGGWVPNLALSATPDTTYTKWTVVLRQGVTFHNGDSFDADVVVANYAAMAADSTVGLAVAPILASVTKVDTYTVLYTTKIPFSTLPASSMAEQQTAYMADWPGYMTKPTQIYSGQTSTFPANGVAYSGNPIGTGPFKFVSWTVGSQSQWTANKNYWKKDAKGRQLPYLNGITFKTIADPTQRNLALQSGSCDMIVQQDNASIAALANMKGISYRTDANDLRSPSVNQLILNSTATMNQYFAWAGLFAPTIPGTLPYLEKGQAAPAAVQAADLAPATGRVNPTTLKWDPTLKPVLNDAGVRKALAQAINQAQYHAAIEDNFGTIARGLYKTNSPFYSNSGYPTYNPSAATAAINAYKNANGVSSVDIVLDYVSGSQVAAKEFAFFQQAFGAIGVTLTGRPLVQSDMINGVIYGQYDMATWNQFGGVDPANNYVWFNSAPASGSLASGGLGMNAAPANQFIPGAVNFGHQADPVIERAMLAALAAPAGSATQIANWKTVNEQMSGVDIPYLYLSYTLSAFAARTNVQNWGAGVGGDGKTAALQFDGGACFWDLIWKS